MKERNSKQNYTALSISPGKDQKDLEMEAPHVNHRAKQAGPKADRKKLKDKKKRGVETKGQKNLKVRKTCGPLQERQTD